jgi:L-rhamnose mutarotase
MPWTRSPFTRAFTLVRKRPTRSSTASCARGVHEWRIWRRGLDLFHLVIAEDYELFVNTPVTNEVAAGWGALMSEFLALNNDFGASNRMTQVWALKDQLVRPLERE